jgi:hypothetical protein
VLTSAVYSADENEFVQLGHKHNFSRCCFGVLLGMLHNNLEGEVHIRPKESSVGRRGATDGWQAWQAASSRLVIGSYSKQHHCLSGRLLLAELRVQQCNNFFASGTETLDAVTCCATKLKKLHLLEMRCHASNHALACLGTLTQVAPRGSTPITAPAGLGLDAAWHHGRLQVQSGSCGHML